MTVRAIVDSINAAARLTLPIPIPLEVHSTLNIGLLVFSLRVLLMTRSCVG